jgi:hypothetical protein
MMACLDSGGIAISKETFFLLEPWRRIRKTRQRDKGEFMLKYAEGKEMIPEPKFALVPRVVGCAWQYSLSSDVECDREGTLVLPLFEVN